jgi:hypothetical protein
MAKFYALNKYVHGLDEQCLSDDEAIAAFTRIAMDGLFRKRPASVRIKERQNGSAKARKR